MAMAGGEVRAEGVRDCGCGQFRGQRDKGRKGARMGEHKEFDEFVATIAALRAPDGCPWDREQTHASIAHNMIEEAYEAVDAIEAGDAAHLREELGDVLLQVVLQSQIAADAGEFTINDVCRDVNAKMVRRHPHIFGNAQASTPEEVAGIWDAVKLREREAAAGAASVAALTIAEPAGGEPAEDEFASGTDGARASAIGVEMHLAGLLDGVPTSFPALMQAQKISRKVVAVGFEWPDEASVWAKVVEEIEEFKAAETPEDRELEFGDILFALVNVARWNGVDAESALRATCAKFRNRWAFMEGAAWAAGKRIEDLSTDEQEVLWQQAKAHERVQNQQESK